MQVHFNRRNLSMLDRSRREHLEHLQIVVTYLRLRFGTYLQQLAFKLEVTYVTYCTYIT
jgi:hypothetical protein